MKYLYFLLIGVVLFFTISCQNQEIHIVKPDIIPLPNAMEIKEGSFALPQNIRIQTEYQEGEIADLYSQFFADQLGCKPEFVSEGGDLILVKEDLDEEAYGIEIGKEGIIIKASGYKGFFYGLQTLIQFFPPEAFTEVEFQEYNLPYCKIDDAPRFPYRGVHLDVCRHYFPVNFIKKYIDVMAHYKMNRFHWHLTEDQGWRIEIKAFPKLQEISSKRIEKDSTEYGGYYTQEEVKEIVAYATARGIVVIPEIELPGHAMAALAAYPEFSCTGDTLPVANTWGVFDHVYCAGKDTTFAFLQAVLDEVIELFPSKYIHIGGDECPKGAWEKCDDCQARIKAEGLKDEHHLQSYFIQRIEKYLNGKGKKLIGWDEILEGGLAADATVMSWRGTEGGIAAAKQEHYAIMTPGSHCYFDHYQARNEFEPKAICCYTSLMKVYGYEPVPKELTADEAKYILGAQANMWTEYMETSDHVEYMLLPRLLALSEVVWTQAENKNYEDFNNRLQTHRAHLKNKGYNLSDGDYIVQFEELEIDSKRCINLVSEQFEAEIRYAVDGSTPTKDSPIFTEPIEVKTGMEIKAGVFKEGELVRGESVLVVE